MPVMGGPMLEKVPRPLGPINAEVSVPGGPFTHDLKVKALSLARDLSRYRMTARDSLRQPTAVRHHGNPMAQQLKQAA